MFAAGSLGWQAILSDALSDAVKALKENLGGSPARWQWGQLHRLKLKHPLGSVKPLNLIFKGPDVPVGGDTDTPFQTAFAAHEPFAAPAWAPSSRQIVRLSPTDRPVSLYPAGPSGHP